MLAMKYSQILTGICISLFNDKRVEYEDVEDRADADDDWYLSYDVERDIGIIKVEASPTSKPVSVLLLILKLKFNYQQGYQTNALNNR